MLSSLVEVKHTKPDFISFLKDKDKIIIQGVDYEDAGEKIGGSELGDQYHIIIAKDSKNDPSKFSHLDSFDAILSDPFEYISGLIPNGWYGIVARKTTTSHEMYNKILDIFKEHSIMSM